jgi:hypothetical protein
MPSRKAPVANRNFFALHHFLNGQHRFECKFREDKHEAQVSDLRQAQLLGCVMANLQNPDDVQLIKDAVVIPVTLIDRRRLSGKVLARLKHQREVGSVKQAVEVGITRPQVVDVCWLGRELGFVQGTPLAIGPCPRLDDGLAGLGDRSRVLNCRGRRALLGHSFL